MATTPVTILSSNSGWLVDRATGQFGAVTALDAATSIGYSNPIDLGWSSNAAILSIIVTGAPTAITVVLEGSRNGDDWIPFVQSTNVTGEFRSGSGVFRYLRAHLAALTGGTNPTVSVVVAGLPIF